MRGGLIGRFAIDQGVRLAGAGVILFGSAGTILWWPAWAFLAVSAAWVVATAAVIVRNDPSLLAERISPPKGGKRWDVILMSTHAMVQMAIYLVGGLDHRFGWTAGLPLAAQLAALGGCILGYGLTVWATACNPFFSLIVRIQSERGHTVATGGPYRVVRHPAYAGAVLLAVSLGTLFDSPWALLLGCFDGLLMIMRTRLEDRDLQLELTGYAEYAGRVRYRLVPGVW
jgi:protein-S-isoprenylcysteine O-methyltransferase Ste14